MIMDERYITHIKKAHQKLGISESFIIKNNLCIQHEPETVVFVEMDCFGRIQRMEPNTANSWKKMKEAAMHDQVSLNIISAFRSVQDQILIIEKKLAKNIMIEDILTVSAPPGYSEHHTGTAVDISDGNHNELIETFEQSNAFDWLTKNAKRFNFKLSYPRNNPFGIMYEPWHWKFHGS